MKITQDMRLKNIISSEHECAAALLLLLEDGAIHPQQIEDAICAFKGLAALGDAPAHLQMIASNTFGEFGAVDWEFDEY